jgi:protein TonB
MTGLEDIVYEGRNKEYGSFMLRKQFPKAMMVGFIGGLLLVLLPVLGLFFYYQVETYSELSDVNVEVVDVMQLLDIPRFEMPERLPPTAKSKPAPTAPVIDQEEKKTTPPQDSAKNAAARDSIQKNDQAASSDTSNSTDTAYFAATDVEQMANFEGGEIAFRRYLIKNFTLPPSSSGKIAGKVVIEFIVDKKGEVKNVKILSGLTKEINDQALRVIRSSPRWNPAYRRGKPVDVVYSITLNLKNY